MEINSLIHNSFLFSEYKQEAFPAKARANSSKTAKNNIKQGSNQKHPAA
jgi:hypothetical protein